MYLCQEPPAALSEVTSATTVGPSVGPRSVCRKHTIHATDVTYMIRNQTLEENQHTSRKAIFSSTVMATGARQVQGRSVQVVSVVIPC